MTLPLDSSPARPVAWQWRCPECRLVVVLIRKRTGLSVERSCRHFVAAEEREGKVEVRYGAD